MDDFMELLNDTVGLTAALRAVQLDEKERDKLGQLFASRDGFLASRDTGNRVRGETVHHCSKIGGYLTSHFNGVGPKDKMMWVGCIERDKKGVEHWVMRPQMRAAVKALQWF